MNDNAHDEGLTHTGDRYAISDRDLDRLAEAELAWDRWDRTARWWATGDLDAIESWSAA